MELKWEHLWLVSLWHLSLDWHVLVFIKIKRKGNVVVAAVVVVAALAAVLLRKIQIKIYI